MVYNVTYKKSFRGLSCPIWVGPKRLIKLIKMSIEILIQQKKELKELWLWNQNKKLDTLSIFKQLKKEIG